MRWRERDHLKASSRCAVEKTGARRTRQGRPPIKGVILTSLFQAGGIAQSRMCANDTSLQSTTQDAITRPENRDKAKLKSASKNGNWQHRINV